MRKNLFGPSEVIYSGYTCYTGIADFVPPDIESVGYVLFIFEFHACFSSSLAWLHHGLLKTGISTVVLYLYINLYHV